jgi:hypothetical protein
MSETPEIAGRAPLPIDVETGKSQKTLAHVPVNAIQFGCHPRA